MKIRLAPLAADRRAFRGRHRMVNTARRNLTSEELRVLSEVRAFWGPQNSAADVVFSENNEAVMFVKRRDGDIPVMIVLTNLGKWLADGTLSKGEMRKQVMGPAAAGHSSLYVKGMSMFARIRAFILGWN